MFNTVTVFEGYIGLLYTRGRFERTLAPGRYRLVLFSFWGGPQTVRILDMRRTTLNISGQRVFTADGIGVGLNVAADYRVTDAPRAAHTVQDYAAALYNALQILVRDEVQSRPLDALLADRSALTNALLLRGRDAAAELGLELLTVGVKDVILGADVKKMLALEAEALRAGRAALVAAREEVATLRARANGAKLFADTPALLRLRELETLAEIGRGPGNTVVLPLSAEVTGVLGAVGAAKGSS